MWRGEDGDVKCEVARETDKGGAEEGEEKTFAQLVDTDMQELSSRGTGAAHAKYCNIIQRKAAIAEGKSNQQVFVVGSLRCDW